MFFLLFSFLRASLNKINEDKVMSRSRFNKLLKVVIITHARTKWSWYLKQKPNLCLMFGKTPIFS